MYIKRQDIINKYSNTPKHFYLNENKLIKDGVKEYDLFLSYNHKDFDLAKAIYLELISQGIKVYVDFKDNSFQRITNQETAKILCDRLSSCKALAYIHTKNARESKWCPWEIGLASGLKNFKCIIIPAIENNDNEFERQEYLMLYPFVTYEAMTKSNYHYIFWVRSQLGDNPIQLKQWIKTN